MIKFVVFSIFVAFVLYNWQLFIPISWYSSGVEDNIENVLSSYGYPMEAHQVKTEDGYLLTIHRIPYGRNDNEESIKNQRKPPVFLMHGLLCSSVDWIINGRNKSMALILADSGYDVWIGNNRGNTYSRKHVSLSPEDQKNEFFNYSYHEIGIYDLPAMIDHVLSVTGYDQLTYLGYSEGFTSFVVMGSLRPEYNKKILLMNGFAPVTNIYNITNYIFNVLAVNPKLLELADILNWVELFSHSISPASRLFCATVPAVCTNIFHLVGSSEEQVPNQELRMSILTNFPAGMSLKQITHYIQGTRTGIFGYFDHGEQNNLKKYGTPVVPLYDLTKVSAPIILYYGESDNLVNNDILLNSVAKELPNVVKIFKVPYPHFNHLDFIWGKEVDKLTEEAMTNINNYNNKANT